MGVTGAVKQGSKWDAGVSGGVGEWWGVGVVGSLELVCGDVG